MFSAGLVSCPELLFRPFLQGATCSIPAMRITAYPRMMAGRSHFMTSNTCVARRPEKSLSACRSNHNHIRSQRSVPPGGGCVYRKARWFRKASIFFDWISRRSTGAGTGAAHIIFTSQRSKVIRNNKAAGSVRIGSVLFFGVGRSRGICTQRIKAGGQPAGFFFFAQTEKQYAHADMRYEIE